jgi:hypothetical protein
MGCLPLLFFYVTMKLSHVMNQAGTFYAGISNYKPVFQYGSIKIFVTILTIIFYTSDLLIVLYQPNFIYSYQINSIAISSIPIVF